MDATQAKLSAKLTELEADGSREGEAGGIHLASSVPLRAVGVQAYAILSSPNVEIGFERGCRYRRLMGEELLLELQRTERGASLSLRPGRATLPPPRAVEWLFALWLRLGRTLVGEPWVPARVRFAHGAPSSRLAHEQCFGSALEFSAGHTVLDIDRRVLDARNPRWDPAVSEGIDASVPALVAGAARGGDWTARVFSSVLRELRRGAPTAREVAQALGMNPRAVQERLAEEGTSFADVYEAARYARALSLLRNPELHLREVAFLLGYSEFGAFERAVQRWVSLSPEQLRAKALSDAPK